MGSEMFGSQIERAIRDIVNERVAAVAEEEIARACERTRERVGAEMDALALKVLRFYEVQHMQDRVVISVRKPE